MTEHETSKKLADALNGDRDAALDMWRCVERFPGDPDSIVWSQEVARRILNAERNLAADPKKGARRRPDEMQKAVGLSRRPDKHRRLRDFVEVMRCFENLDRKGPPKRDEESKQLYKAIQKRAQRDLDEEDRENRFFSDYDDEYLHKLTDRLHFELDKLVKTL